MRLEHARDLIGYTRGMGNFSIVHDEKELIIYYGTFFKETYTILVFRNKNS